jgi:hypothetical protein
MNITAFVVIAFLVVIGLWRDKVVLSISGFCLMIYGFTLWSNTEWLSIGVMITGFYLIIKALVLGKGSKKDDS